MIYDPAHPEKGLYSIGNYGETINTIQELSDKRVAVGGNGGKIITISLSPIYVMANKTAGTFVNAASGVEHNISEIPSDSVTLVEPKGRVTPSEEKPST